MSEKDVRGDSDPSSSPFGIRFALLSALRERRQGEGAQADRGGRALTPD